LLLWSGIQRFSGRTWVATLTACVPIGVPLLADHGVGLVQGYAEFPLAVVYLASVCYLMVWRQMKFPPGWAVAALCAGLLPWVKQDGLLLLAGLLAVGALVHGRADWRRFLAFAFPGIVVAVSWRASMSLLHGVASADYQSITLENLARDLPRLGVILRFIGWRLTVIKSWSLLWYWVPVALAYLAWRQRRLALCLLTGLFLPLVLDAVPYLFTTRDLRLHLIGSADRLILQVSLLAVFCLGLALASPQVSEPLKEIGDDEIRALENHSPG
jgi:hypothetical protein